MARPSDKALLDAISRSGGSVTFIARRFGVTWRTARKWIDRSEATRYAFDEQEEETLDIAVLHLLAAINRGERWAIEFWLTTMGRRRGFSKPAAQHRPELTVSVNAHQ